MTKRITALAQCVDVLGDGDGPGLVRKWLKDADGRGRPSSHGTLGLAVKENVTQRQQTAADSAEEATRTLGARIKDSALMCSFRWAVLHAI